ncbi:IPT/TIG domain-containing protein [Nocardia mikamii]|uniref:IPT/TIG domain-containing protein n=1 Tax=Nocardia mikamii TaxID=508464 RepID=UPI000A6F4866|nr:IPT/TIG domain-containing protein [Nocardia mikamii]
MIEVAETQSNPGSYPRCPSQKSGGKSRAYHHLTLADVRTGSGLTGVTAVNFGATPATSFTVDSDTQITAVAPAGTGIVSVTVTGPGGTSNSATYVYVVVPSITSVSPSSGPATGGNNVTITGTDFTGPLTVRFGTTATTFTVNSSTQVTAVAPAHAAGTVQITVTGSGGTSNGVAYTFV